MPQAQEPKHLNDHFSDWFREYGSYVILHRAVPHIADGLKPSQRRVLFSLYELEDGRYNKAASVVGNTMKFHPHGDGSVFETLVGIGQKGYLIDTQGNWGNILTGDSAAAPRYIEARLSPFANTILFNPKTTQWADSYDGRNKEPVTLPVKFPLLLLQGTEGIAVSLSCKILPHNFQEICRAAIASLKKEPYTLLPDFPQGGIMDASNYNNGFQGGKIKIRARISPNGKHALEISEIPFGTTTISLRDSILDAESRGKIKIKKVTDMTSSKASIIVEYPPGTNLDTARDALYAFTQCEISHSTNCCVIQNGKPAFLSANHLLEDATSRTQSLIAKELEIELAELSEHWQKISLEMIFITSKAYSLLESASSKEDAISQIQSKLSPYYPQLRQPPTEQQITALLEIPIRRIAKYDLAAAQKELDSISAKEKSAKAKLKNITQTTIDYFQSLLDRFGTNWPRKTEIASSSFGKIEAGEVTAVKQKVFWNPIEGFIGTSLKKDELLPFEVHDLTDVAAFNSHGILKICRPGEKTFFAKDLIDARIVAGNGESPIYCIAYLDKKTGISFAKKFKIDGGFIRDKEYLVAGDSPENEILFSWIGPEEKAPSTLNVRLKDSAKARIKSFTFDFSEIAVKNRSAKGNQITKYPVRKIAAARNGGTASEDAVQPDEKNTSPAIIANSDESEPIEEGGQKMLFTF